MARIALVTGANRGIGREIARQLASHGLAVLAGVRNPAEMPAGPGITPTALDVTRPEMIARVAAGLAPTGLDVLVNNAGVSLDGFDAEVARQTLDVNVFGAWHLTDAMLPHLRPGGRIVMVSSSMGQLSCVSPELRARLADPTLGRADLVELMESFVSDVRRGTHERRGWPSNAYRVSKVGMNALVRLLARELGDDPRRILVNAACPGWVKTRMGGSSAPRSPEEGARTPVWLALLPSDGPTGGFFRDERPTSF
jgi:carbonyl reductase 1